MIRTLDANLRGTGPHSLHVLAAMQAPRLDLNASQCLIVADKPDLKIGDILHIVAKDQRLCITKITWLLGALRPVQTTDRGHRYVIEFDCDGLPNNITESYAFELL